MKNHIVLIVLLLYTTCLHASVPEVLTEFFGPNGIKNKANMYHGEMITYYVDKPTLGETLPKNVQTDFRILKINKTTAIYAVLLSHDGKTQDYYAYLYKKNNLWKLSAIRSLALPGIFFMALQEIESKEKKTEEDKWQYQNMLLIIESDKNLKAYLKDNIKIFNKAVAMLNTGKKKTAAEVAKSLFINSVSSENNIIDFSIGGIIDNSVGYLFVPKGNQPPNMSSSSYIYIEKITDSWYIYKTT